MLLISNLFIIFSHPLPILAEIFNSLFRAHLTLHFLLAVDLGGKKSIKNQRRVIVA
jgi:pilus assembly protein TadC